LGLPHRLFLVRKGKNTMANRLTMAKVNAILSLHQSGHSNRRIAKLLGVDRETVGKYVEAAENQPNAPTGSTHSLPPISASGLSVPTGPPSTCDPYRELIQAKLEQRLSGQRIYQDLLISCEGNYSTKTLR